MNNTITPTEINKTDLATMLVLGVTVLAILAVAALSGHHQQMVSEELAMRRHGITTISCQVAGDLETSASAEPACVEHDGTGNE